MLLDCWSDLQNNALQDGLCVWHCTIAGGEEEKDGWKKKEVEKSGKSN